MGDLDGEERAAIRAFLQRSEVRLSTVHRVATALLSGAGLMVLLPAIARDSIVTVIRSLVNGELDLAHLCLVGAIVISFGLPITALGLLLRDLTRFYFTRGIFTMRGPSCSRLASRSPRCGYPLTSCVPRPLNC